MEPTRRDFGKTALLAVSRGPSSAEINDAWDHATSSARDIIDCSGCFTDEFMHVGAAQLQRLYNETACLDSATAGPVYLEGLRAAMWDRLQQLCPTDTVIGNGITTQFFEGNVHVWRDIWQTLSPKKGGEHRKGNTQGKARMEHYEQERREAIGVLLHTILTNAEQKDANSPLPPASPLHSSAAPQGLR